MKERLKKLPESNKQAIKFIIIGVMAVITDMICYYIFLSVLPEKVLGMENEVVGKAMSFLCGFSVTYTFNNRWTWRKSDHSRGRLMKFVFLYTMSLVINVVLNSSFLFILKEYSYIFDFPYKYFIAFIGATGFSSIFNFLGQKFWVFADRTPEELEADEAEV